MGATHLLAHPRREHLLHARVDQRVQLPRAPSSSPTSSVGWRSSALHSRPAILGRLELAGVEQLQRAHDALAVVRVDPLGRPRRAARELGVQRRRPAPLELGGPVLARALGRRRSQIELGERRAQVQAGAADDDRAPPGGQQPIDLGVRELGVLADAERRVERQEGDEAMFERCPLDRGGDAR